MKKSKNDELKSYSSLKHVKEGKIKKNKQGIDEKLKDAIGETVDFNLAQKKQGSEFKKTGDDGNRTKSKKIKNETEYDLQNGLNQNENKLVVVPKKQNEFEDIKTNLQDRNPDEIFEKKKAKKLAKKLEKRLKAQSRDNKNASAAIQNIEQKDVKNLGQNVVKPVHENSVKRNIPLLNGKQKSPKGEIVVNKNVETPSSSTLTKQAKKAMRRHLLKEEKRENIVNKNVTSTESIAIKEQTHVKEHAVEDQTRQTADNQNDVATGKLLTKKEKKALKRKLIKDKKLESIENKNIDTSIEEILKKDKTAVKDQKLQTAGNQNFNAKIDKGLTKKERKALKKQLIKDQKLESTENENTVTETNLILKKGKTNVENVKLKTADDKNLNSTIDKILTKKEKKVLKRQLIKDQKLESIENKHTVTKTDAILKKEKTNVKEHLVKDQKQQTTDNQNVVATSSKVLTKKEKKALKRQSEKDQKLNEKRIRDPAIEEATVFVGNLPVNTKRVQLQHIFKKFGPVNFIRLRSAGGKILHKHKQRKLAGSLNAYVVLQNKEKAEKAISLNGFEFKGNHLRVTLATEKPENQDKGEAKRTVFVGNLKYSASEESLREIFSSCGEIEYVRCIRDGDKGCKGVAYVCFRTADAVGLALELNETIVEERSIHVERYNVKKLGAKQAREAQAEKENKSKTGAKLRLENKKDKKEKSGHKLQNHGEVDSDKKAKKSEFRGVKVEGLKKKQKPKKKKSNDQMVQLAKKIAPKPKN